MMRQTPFSLLVVVVGLFLGLVGAMEPTSVDVMENEWYNFNCDYNERGDSRSVHELALNIQDCSTVPHVAMKKSHLSASVAVVFGKFSSEEAEIRAVMRNQNWPLYYANPDNVYVKDGLVRVIKGDVNSISIRVNATKRMEGICITCNQVQQFRDFESTKKESLKIRNSPTASATVNGAVQLPTSPVNGLQLNDSVTIVCRASGPEKLSVKLLQNSREIAASAAGQSSLTHVIARAGRDSAGIYKCQVATDLQFLVDRGLSTGTLEFVLAVKFPPEFEVSEIIRYTQIGNNENIRIKVQSYPAARLTCSPPSDMPIRESYNDRQFANEYDLTLTNLASEKKESTFDCTATNEIGQRRLRIRLTAKAPIPKILSSSDTKWSNSYKLEWQHDQNATIDYYLVQIVYKNSEDNSEVNTTEIKFSPTEQKGAMALVDGKAKNGKLVHSGVLVNLNPDSNHDIRLRSCNGHGCSDFSPSISVKTPAKSAANYNDPRNPMKGIPSKASIIVHSSRSAHLVSLALALPLLIAGTQRLL